MNHLYLKLAMPSVMILMAAFFWVVSLKILLTRKPLFISSRWLFGVVIVGIAPSMFNPILFNHFTLISIAPPLMFVVMLVFFWFQMKGYIAIAVSDGYFRDALLSSIKDLGYTAEETMSRLRIKETGEEFHVVIQGWMGGAQLKPVGKSSSTTTQEIAKRMNLYFSNTKGQMNYILAYMYLIFGVFMIAMAVGIFMLPHTLKH